MTTPSPWWAGGRRKTLIATALLLVLAYVAIAVITDASRLADALRQLGVLGCAGVLALSSLNYLLRFQRWKTFLAALGRQLPLGRHLLYYLGGFAFTISPAKAGEAVRSLYLREHGVTYAESIAAFFVERLLDLFVMVMLASLIVLDHPAYRPLVAASFLAVVLVIVRVCQPSFAGLIERIGARRIGAPFEGRIGTLCAAFVRLLRSSQRLLHPRPLISGIVLGLMAWSAESLGFGVICQGLHISGAVWSFCGIYAIAVLAGTITFFLPAGIGGTEIVMTTLLVERGADLRVAIIATLLCRLATLWFAVLIGIGAASAVELSDQKLRVPVAP